ncbi:WW domain-containing oxidoreductase [Phytophthora cinnamomi]|uniref:WW domain-containing oxidoreductase n=1 Tax=Phytophthora cinnamomi TaxID=4785 RepID=UPI003559E392|nr:WW domain-containing oxidoreductase [Phytophthora cinnamomi]
MGRRLTIENKRELIDKSAAEPGMTHSELARWSKRAFRLRKAPARNTVSDIPKNASTIKKPEYGEGKRRKPLKAEQIREDIPSQKGRVVVVTGANSGIGFETALELARKGADVVLACRNEQRGREAETKLRETLAATPEAGKVTFVKLDLGDLASVKKFAADFKQNHDRLDLLINNAGIMGGVYGLSADGYERQFATNHLGHFALTAQLFPLLKRSTPSRVVNVSSMMHRSAPTWNEDDIMVTSEDKYREMDNYGVTKLSNILFSTELSRRIKAAGVGGVTSVACHPGITATSLATASAANSSGWLWWLVYKVTDWSPRQSCSMGALPTLYAATGSEVEGGDFFGPKHLKTFGYPVREDPSELSKSESGAKKLWTLSERLTKLSFDIEK